MVNCFVEVDNKFVTGYVREDYLVMPQGMFCGVGFENCFENCLNCV